MTATEPLVFSPRNDPPVAGEKILLLGVGERLTASLEDLLAVPVIAARDIGEARRILTEQPVAALCIGELLPGERALHAIRELAHAGLPDSSRLVVLAAGERLEVFQDLVDEQRLSYLFSAAPPPDDVAAILVPEPGRRMGPAAGVPVDAAHDVLDLLARLRGSTGLRGAGILLAESATAAVAADRARLLWHDPAASNLSTDPDDENPESTAAGIAAYVAHTGATVRLARAAGDPRWDPETDDPDGGAGSHVLAIAVPGTGEQVAAVLVLARDGERSPFSKREAARLERLVSLAAPALQVRMIERQAEAASTAGQGPAELFRREALEHGAQGLERFGRPMRISPVWAPWAYRLLLLAVVAGIVYGLLGSMHEYAAGTALVRMAGDTEITVARPGVVEALHVRPGQRVVVGEPLVSLDDGNEAAEVDRLRRELELVLIKRLQDPSDPATERPLATLRSQKLHAEARHAERRLRAPRDGRVGELRVLPGQYLSPGETVLTLGGEGAEPTLVALFPGRYRPLIRAGMVLRFEPNGYQGTAQELTVERIEDRLLGPAEARRLLGDGIADSVHLTGAVALAYARFPSSVFASEGRQLRLHAGMQGRAEIRVRSERLLSALVPGWGSVGKTDG